MILLVNDANIFIDLLKINLLPDFFQLPYEFHVTDLVAVEIHEENRHELDACMEQGVLFKKSFVYEELMEIQLLQVKYQRLSIPDCSCLFHAKKTSFSARQESTARASSNRPSIWRLSSQVMAGFSF